MGLAVIAALKLKGVHPIVAADFSPRRRQLAQQMGADVVVDPKEKSPHESWQRDGRLQPTRERRRNCRHGCRGPPLRPAVIFECVGVPGVIESIMTAAPANTRDGGGRRVHGAGHFEPMFGINKELNLQFVLGYNGEEFATTLHNLAEGKVNGDPLMTGKVGVEGVAQAFEDLASPETHAKILVEPWRS